MNGLAAPAPPLPVPAACDDPSGTGRGGAGAARPFMRLSCVILSIQNKTGKPIVSTLNGMVSTKLTDRLIELLDFDFTKKTRMVFHRFREVPSPLTRLYPGIPRQSRLKRRLRHRLGVAVALGHIGPDLPHQLHVLISLHAFTDDLRV